MSARDTPEATIVVAVAQTAPKLGDSDSNLELNITHVEEAAEAGCALVVLPECSNSGYVFETVESAQRAAEEIPGPTTDALSAVCARRGVYVVVGLLEREALGLRNSAVLIGPEGLVGIYRKTHLPGLGVDRFVVPGDGPFKVYETAIGRIGIEICYDLRFPEVTRAYALAGAELITHPTNWPLAAMANADFLTRARAYENRVFVLSASRVGTEHRTEYCGWSQIVDPDGLRLAEAGRVEEILLTASVDLAQARAKDFVPVGAEHEVRVFGDRRPTLYGALTDEVRPPDPRARSR
jgi:predicted amidohydrolase